MRIAQDKAVNEVLPVLNLCRRHGSIHRAQISRDQSDIFAGAYGLGFHQFHSRRLYHGIRRRHTGRYRLEFNHAQSLAHEGYLHSSSAYALPPPCYWDGFPGGHMLFSFLYLNFIPYIYCRIIAMYLSVTSCTVPSTEAWIPTLRPSAGLAMQSPVFTEALFSTTGTAGAPMCWLSMIFTL